MGRWHPDVGDHDIGLVLAHLAEELLRVAGLADNEEAGVFEHAYDTGSQQEGVLGHDDAGGRSAGALTCRAGVLAVACSGPVGS